MVIVEAGAHPSGVGPAIQNLVTAADSCKTGLPIGLGRRLGLQHCRLGLNAWAMQNLRRNSRQNYASRKGYLYPHSVEPVPLPLSKSQGVTIANSVLLPGKNRRPWKPFVGHTLSHAAVAK